MYAFMFPTLLCGIRWFIRNLGSSTSKYRDLDLQCLRKERCGFGPTGLYLLNFFCSGIQSYLLLSPYICIFSFLYLDLYVLGDDALVS